eukprot:jgi/Mesvir1/12258/Mv00474-RA.1
MRVCEHCSTEMYVSHKLEADLEERYAVNPVQLVARIRRLESDILTIQEEAQRVLTEKQAFVDAAKSTLLWNRQMLLTLLQRAGTPTLAYASSGPEDTNEGGPLSSEAAAAKEEALFAKLSTVINEWEGRLQSREWLPAVFLLA